VISGTLRDIAIIIVAVETIIINALLIILIWQVWRLIRMIKNEVKPILDDTKETVNTVKGTADFVSHNVVDPVAKSGGRVAGWRRSFQVMSNEVRISMQRPTRPPQPPPPQSPPNPPQPPAP
jgi:hypothetical protein